MNNSTYLISSVAMDSNLMLDFSQRLESLNMLFNYTDYIFPVIYLDALLTIEEFKQLENRSNLRIKLSLKKINNINPYNKAINAYDYCFKDIIFKVVDKNNKYITNSNNVDSSNSSNLVKTRFVLLQEEDLEANKISSSGSFNNCNMKALINHLINNRLKQDKKTIMAEPDNQMVYPQILLPYNNVVNSIKYLDNAYGIYKDGLKLFFDLHVNYILNKNGNVFNQPGLVKNIVIDIPNSENIATMELYENNITILPGDFSYNDISQLKSEVTGTDNSFVLNNEDNSILNKKWDSDNDKQQVYYQKYNNPYLRNQINPEINNFITAIARNADYDLINFINEFSIKEYNNSTFKDMRFNLAQYNHTFRRNRDNIFELVSRLSLKKI